MQRRIIGLCTPCLLQFLISLGLGMRLFRSSYWLLIRNKVMGIYIYICNIVYIYIYREYIYIYYREYKYIYIYIYIL